ncbi:MAG: hypothetical protein K6T83_11625 [Alicyclobacillus sp.]|nr:hypothetical protein [Alicyclobacillus sp.]
MPKRPRLIRLRPGRQVGPGLNDPPWPRCMGRDLLTLRRTRRSFALAIIMAATFVLLTPIKLLLTPSLLVGAKFRLTQIGLQMFDGVIFTVLAWRSRSML